MIADETTRPARRARSRPQERRKGTTQGRHARLGRHVRRCRRDGRARRHRDVGVHPTRSTGSRGPVTVMALLSVFLHAVLHAGLHVLRAPAGGAARTAARDRARGGRRARRGVAVPRRRRRGDAAGARRSRCRGGVGDDVRQLAPRRHTGGWTGVALAARAPWGANVYGGRVATPDGVLPPGYRVASLTAASTLSLAAWVLLARVGVVGPGRLPRAVIDKGPWAIGGYLAVNTVANLASTSAVERWGLGAVTALAAGLSWQVARSPAVPPSPHGPSRTGGARP